MPRNKRNHSNKKPTHLEPMLRNKRNHSNKKPTHRNEEKPPLAATRESPRAATKAQHSQNKQIKKKKKKRVSLGKI